MNTLTFRGLVVMFGKKREIDMCSGPLLGKVLMFSLPLMFSGILQLLYNAADIVIVGRFEGNASLAAVGSTGALINLIVNLFVGFSLGASVTVAQYLGARNYEQAHRTVHTAIAVSLVSGVFVLGIGLFFSRQMLELMSTPDDVIGLATLYLKIYFLGAPAMMLYNFGSSILRAMGDTVRPLIFLTVSGAVNVLLNIFFVRVLRMNVAGVALATVISEVMSAVLVVICLMRLENSCCLRPKEIRFYKENLLRIIKIGLPSGLQGALFSISNMVVQSSINSFGSLVVAANSSASNIQGFTFTSMDAVCQAATTFTSQNVGAKKVERVRRVAAVSLLSVTVIGLVMGVGSTLLGRWLIKIYSEDPAIIPYGLVSLRYVCAPYFICGIMNVFVGMLRGMGCSTTPMVVTIFGTCISRIVWLKTLFPLHRSLEMIYIVYPLSWLLTAAIQIVCYFVVKKRLAKRLKAQEENEETADYDLIKQN